MTGGETMPEQRLEDQPTSEDIDENESFVIIGIGTSAGGLEALKAFFDYVPPDFPHSFVVIQHLSPDYKSMMADLLSKNTQMPIYEVTDEMEVKAASVYLIPPGKNMTLQEGRLRLTDKPSGYVLNFPINIFFESLARERHEQAIGIVLSGTGSDGTIGLRAIKEVGGLTLAQSPESAAFNGMPNSAISTGLVDFVLPPWQMPNELERYLSKPINYLLRNFGERDEQGAFNQILSLLQDSIGVDFSLYKRPTLLRRLQRRLVVTNCQTLPEYLDYLSTNPREIHTLYREFLIHVTHFFRDPEAWNIVQESVIPEILQNKAPNEPVKCWVVGCSSGEEAYTLAMLLDEALNEQGRRLEVKIFATDIEKEHLDHAARGLYPESISADVTLERLRQYFSKEGESYVVSPALRRMVIFSQHDAVKDPPFGKLDLVLCRNLLIYLLPEVQRDLLNVLHYALNVKGHLFLGPSETLGDPAPSFQEISRRWRIYRNTNPSRGLVTRRATNVVFNPQSAQPQQRTSLEMSEALNTVLLDQLDAACVFVDENYYLVHAVGEYNRYLDIPRGQFSLSLLKMVPESLYIGLTAALHKASRLREQVTMPSVRVNFADGTSQQIRLIVTPFAAKGGGSEFYIIFFLPNVSNRRNSESATGVSIESVGDGQAILEQALKEAQAQLQSALEEAQTSNEELQATNEELMASNEELQSTNEELQSVNEELHTVNTEYQLKVDELERVNTEMENLLRSTQIGTIFLDREFRIRSFTPAIVAQFDLLPTDVGRPLEQLAGKLSGDDTSTMMEIARHVLETATPNEREIRIGRGKYYLQRIYPYIDARQTIGGIVLSFVDITSQKIAENKVQELSAKLSLAISAGQVGIWEYDLINNTIDWNDQMHEIYGVSQEDFDNSFEAVTGPIHPDDIQSVLETWEENLQRSSHDFAYRIILPDGPVRYIRGRGFIEHDETNTPISAIGTTIDVTDLTEQQRELAELNFLLTESQSLAHLGTWEVNTRTGATYWSDEFFRIVGIEPGSVEPTSELGVALIHPDDKEPALKVINESVEEKLPYEIQVRIIRPDGEIRWVIFSGAYVGEANEEPYRRIGSLLDITELQQVTERLKTALAEREATNYALEEFAYAASHDLREPMNTIGNFVSLILRKYAHEMDEEGLQMLDFIYESTERMKKLIKALLEYSRLGNNDLTFSQVNLDHLLAEVTSDLAHLIDGYSADIQYDIDTAIIADRIRLSQVFLNLIANAIKYSKLDVPPQITIKMQDTDTHWQFSVEDNGIGIADKHQKRVFQIFQQLQPREKQVGIGLGLALCKRIVLLHGGTIWLESTLEQGTTVFFTIQKNHSLRTPRE